MHKSIQHLDAGLEHARGQIHGFFAGVLLNRPDQQWLEGLLNQEMVSALQLIFPDHPAAKRLARLADDRNRVHRMHGDFLLEYEALFRVPGDAFTHPYESAYLAAEDQDNGKGKAFLNASRARLVVRAYQEAGLAPGPDFDEPPDHLGAQFDFVARLCQLTAEELEKGEIQDALRLRDHQELFLREHLLAWGAKCFAKVERLASTDLYRSLAGLGKVFLEMERQRHLQ